MIKVFKLSDLIKYFFKFIIPIIVLVICLNVFIKRGSNNQLLSNNKSDIKRSTKIEITKDKGESNSINNEKKEKNIKQDKKTDKESSKQNKKEDSTQLSNLNEKPYYFCLDNEIVNLKNVKDETNIDFMFLAKKIIQGQFGILGQSNSISKIDKESKKNTENTENAENMENTENAENTKNTENIENTDNANNNNNSITSNEQQNNEKNSSSNSSDAIKQAEENVKTEIVSNAVNPRFNYNYNGVKIYNSTKYKLTDEMLDTSSVNVNKNKVLIYHTHTCESYTPTENFKYEQTGNFRTTDLDFSVARVGEELKRQLESYNIQVVQNKSYHDYPSYNGSYSRSLVTANNMLNENKDADIVIDLHRDAIADSTYSPKVKIGDEYVSQMMFVIGTDIGNSEHTHWNDNLKFAVKVQQKANEMYPGLFKPIILRSSEYNQHIAKAACIIEVGATGNTLEESICAMKYLAKVLTKF